MVEAGSPFEGLGEVLQERHTIAELAKGLEQDRFQVVIPGAWECVWVWVGSRVGVWVGVWACRCVGVSVGVGMSGCMGVWVCEIRSCERVIVTEADKPPLRVKRGAHAQIHTAQNEGCGLTPETA